MKLETPTNREKLESAFYNNRYNIYSRGLENTVKSYWIMTSKFYREFINEDSLWNVFELNNESEHGEAFGFEIFISNDKNIIDFKLVNEFN